MMKRLQTFLALLFSPAVWLLNRLTYPRKFILIGLVFALPLGLVLFLLIGELDDRINFSQKEIVGNALLKPLRSILQELQVERGLRGAEMQLDFIDSQLALSEVQLKINTKIALFSTLEKSTRSLFSVQDRWNHFLKSWQSRLEKNPLETRKTRFETDTQRISLLLELMTDVADRSNLILDPDLDSYYLMTSVVTQLPMLTEQIGQARGWGTAVIEQGMIEAEDAIYLSNLVGVVTKAQADSFYSYEVIFRENPKLKPKLKPLLDKRSAASDVFLQTLNEAIFKTKGEAVSPQEYWNAGTAAGAANFELYDVSSGLLDEVLQKRIDGFKNKKNGVLFFTFSVLLLVIYLVAAFYMAMMQVIFMLSLVSQRIFAGQIGEETLFKNAYDEMGQVVDSFSKLVVRLRNERDQSASLIVNTPIIVCGISSEGVTQFVNPAGEKLTGYHSAELVGKNWWTTFYPGEAYQQVEKLFLDFERGDVRDYEMTLTTKSGESKIVSWSSIKRFDSHGQLIEVIGFGSDVTEKRKAERRLAAQYAVTQVLAQTTDLNRALRDILCVICQSLNWQEGAIWRVDTKTGLLHCADFWAEEKYRSKAFEQETRLTTFEKGMGLPGRIWESQKPEWILDISRDQNFPRIVGATGDGLHSAIGFPIVYGDEFIGVMEFFSTEVRVTDRELVEIFKENELMAMFKAIGAQLGQFIHRLRIEAQLLQSQKMETVGTLAGGIAHDLNNQLTPISGYIDLLLKSSNLDLRSRTFLEEANLAAKRCAAMVFGLLNFSRPSGQVKTTFRLEQLLKDYEKLLKTMYPANIAVAINYDQSAGVIRGNETEIQTVLMNFAVNSRDAMAATGGKLSLEVSWVDFTGETVRSGRLAGRYAVISVSDTGCGMNQEVIQRIYEPFFTTKPKGKGTGLGLAMVFKIVNEHQGWVDVSSVLGQGTTFKIHLPASADKPRSDDETKAQGELPEWLLGNGEMILFADDVTSVRDLAGVLLERLGYKTLFAANSDEIQELYECRQTDIALVIMDMTMPTIPGRQIMQKILAVNPKARIVVTTGYTNEGSADELIAAGAYGYIPKPYTLRPFAEVIHLALSS